MEPNTQINTVEPEIQNKKYRFLSIFSFLLLATLILILYTYLNQLIFLTKESFRFNAISWLYVEYVLVFLVFLGTITNLLTGVSLFSKWMGIWKYLSSIAVGVAAILLAIPVIAINSILMKADYPEIKRLNDLSPEQKTEYTSNLLKETGDTFKYSNSVEYLTALLTYKGDFEQFPWQEKPLNRVINTLTEVNNLLVNQKYLKSSFFSSPYSNNLSELFLTQNLGEKLSVCFLPKSAKFMSKARNLGLGINGLSDSNCAISNLCYFCVTITNWR